MTPARLRPRKPTGPPKMNLTRARRSSLLLPPNGRRTCPASFAGPAASRASRASLASFANPARTHASPGSLAMLHRLRHRQATSATAAVTAAGLASSPRTSQGGSPARPCSALPRTSQSSGSPTRARSTCAPVAQQGQDSSSTAQQDFCCVEARCEAQVAPPAGAMAEFGHGLSAADARPT